MQSRYHFVASLLVALPSLLDGELRVGLLTLLVGWLIDADHQVDYYLLHGRLALNPLTVGNELGHLDRYGDYRVALIPCHSLELWLVTIPLTPVPVWLAYGVHLVMDWLGNAYHVRFLSLAVRVKTRTRHRRRADRARRPFGHYNPKGARGGGVPRGRAHPSITQEGARAATTRTARVHTPDAYACAQP